MKKDFTELTVAEFYHMEKERLKVYYVSILLSLEIVCKHVTFCLNVYAGVVSRYAFFFLFFFSRKRFVIRRWHICGIIQTIHLRALNLWTLYD